MGKSNGYKSCDRSLCRINGGILAPGEKRVMKDGEVFHPRCFDLVMKARQARQTKPRLALSSRI